MFGIEKDFQNLMEQVYGPLNKDKMTEIEELKGQIKVLEKKVALLEQIEEHKSPVEKAYKDAYGDYPVTDDMSGDDMDYVSWDAFQKGYNAAYEEKVKEWEPTPQTPEQVADGLKEAFREAIKQGIIPEVDKLSDDFMDKMVAKLKGKTLMDLIYDWWEDIFTKNSDLDMENCIGRLVYWIEEWLPKEQSAAGSQNVYVECTVEGFNDCLTKIKGKLR